MSHKHTLSQKKHAENMANQMAKANERRKNGELDNAVKNLFDTRDIARRQHLRAKETGAKPRREFSFH